MDNLLPQFEAYKRRIPQFVIKLYHILQQPQFEEIVSWATQGTQILIKNPKKLQERVLPHFFRHKHLSSFVRQLNMYGFSKANKLTKEKNHTYFRNEFFKKGQIQQLIKIRRKNNKKNLQDNGQYEAVRQSGNQSITSGKHSNGSLKDYQEKVISSIKEIQSQTMRLLSILQNKHKFRRQRLRTYKNKYSFQDNFEVAENSQPNQDVNKKLNRLLEICKQVQSYTSIFKEKCQEMKQQDSCQISIVLNGNKKQNIETGQKQQQYQEKQHNKNHNMFQSFRQVIFPMDSLPNFASKCSLDKQ